MKYCFQGKEDTEQVISFLKKIDGFFKIPLSQKQDLVSLGKKYVENGNVIMAFFENEPCAMTAFYDNDRQTETAYVSVIGVLPEQRGKGVAQALIAAAVRKCTESQMRKMVLHTHKTNIGAQRLYEKLGFIRAEDKNRPCDFMYILDLTKEQK